jgi:MFS family permease
MMLMLSMSYCFFIKVVMKNYGSLHHNDDKYLTSVISIAFLCGASARFGWGILLDIIGFKNVYALILLIEIILPFTITIISHSRVMFGIWIPLSSICEGGHYTIFPALASNIYGAELGSKVYSLLFIG